MSDQSVHPDTAEDLDASVDAFVSQLQPGPAAVADDVTIPDPPSAPSLSAPAPAPQRSEDLLSEISAEIEREAPGPLPVAPPPNPPLASVLPRPTDADIAAASAEVDADLAGFEPPKPEELGHDAAPLVEVPLPAAEEADRPGAEIRHLDATLAANAEQVLERTQLEAEAQPPAPEPAPQPAATTAPAHASTPAAPATPAETVRIAQAPLATDAPSLDAPRESLLARLTAAALTPLAPIAALHERLGESNRQTVGYCAVITLFAASCLWGAMPMLKRGPLEPTTPAEEFYDANTPAHGVTAPPKDEPKKAASHGEGEGGGGGGGGGGHDAKKDAHGKASKAKAPSSGHGGESGGHAPEKKTASTRTKKTAAKAESHGEH